MTKVTEESVQKERMPVFRRNFRQLVDEKGGITAFANYSGFTRQTIGFWYNGPRVPDAESLLKLATVCDCSVDWLLGRVHPDNRSADQKVSDMSAYTGLSSAAIEELHLYQSDSNDFKAEFFRDQAKLAIHLLSWIIAHDRDLDNLSETKESLLDELCNYFRTDPAKGFELIDLNMDKSKRNRGVVGKYGEYDIVMLQGCSASYVNAKLLETAKMISIQERMKSLKQAYWKELYAKGEATITSVFNDTEM
ncbi:MAG: helix-turn-helix transcriptional regulator [Firmicutes bacterium]|nr:helix-turn-helix transcriptional regulator [Bacillota bacterium]